VKKSTGTETSRFFACALSKSVQSTSRRQQALPCSSTTTIWPQDKAHSSFGLAFPVSFVFSPHLAGRRRRLRHTSSTINPARYIPPPQAIEHRYHPSACILEGSFLSAINGANINGQKTTQPRTQRAERQLRKSDTAIVTPQRLRRKRDDATRKNDLLRLLPAFFERH